MGLALLIAALGYVVIKHRAAAAPPAPTPHPLIQTDGYGQNPDGSFGAVEVAAVAQEQAHGTPGVQVQTLPGAEVATARDTGTAPKITRTPAAPLVYGAGTAPSSLAADVKRSAATVAGTALASRRAALEKDRQAKLAALQKTAYGQRQVAQAKQLKAGDPALAAANNELKAAYAKFTAGMAGLRNMTTGRDAALKTVTDAWNAARDKYTATTGRRVSVPLNLMY